MTLTFSDEGWFSHPNALVETRSIGRGTKIWAFAHVLQGARIGGECNICDHVFIENEVVIGDRVTVKCGVQLWDGVTLEDDVFIGPNATFTNDPFPRSRKRPSSYSPTLIRRGASVGANATILCGITVGTNAMVGAGAVVTHDVPSNAIVTGNPSQIQGYVGASLENRSLQDGGITSPQGVQSAVIKGVTIHPLPEFVDLRGALLVGDFSASIPFVPKRFFVVHDVPSRHARGEHAHRTLHQFLVCLKGECSLVADNGEERSEIRLISPSTGVHLPPMIWGVQYKFTHDAILLILASEPYEASDYIRDYDEFMQLARERGLVSEKEGK